MKNRFQVYYLPMAICLLVFGGRYFSVSPQASAQSGVSVYLPAMIGQTLEAAGESTVEPAFTATATATLMPTDAPTATATPQPTATPIPSQNRLYEGVTNQGREILIEVNSELSRVYRLEVETQIACPNGTGSVSTALSDSIGYMITNRAFRITRSSPGGHENIFEGTFDDRGFLASGSWTVWLDGEAILHPCANKGTWNASSQLH
ncbi:MAG: hypothetical protein AAF702_35630 [Chloroflexota bacterium]